MTATPEQVVLREAATAMREHHPISHPEHEMWEQSARMLEEYARYPKLLVVPLAAHVLAVARAYLAAVDRPDIDGRAT